MNKKNRVIGCVSSEERHGLIFRSMIRVLCQGTGAAGLKYQWSYSEAEPFDIRVLDIDDEAHGDWAERSHQGVVVLLGHPARLPADRPLTLSKPLRGNEFLQLLQAIEAMGAEEVPASAPVAPPAPIAPAPVQSPDRRAAPTVEERLISLEQWPDLPRLPEDRMQDAARLCALLAVRPSSRAAISRLLELPEAQVDTLLALIREAAHDGGHPLLRERDAQVSPSAAEPVTTGKPSSFLSKMWNRLRGAA